MSCLLLFFIFSLSTILGSINGQCGSSSNWRDQMEAMEESQRQIGRMGVECETQGHTSGSSNTVSTSNILFDLFAFVFILFWVVIAIWLICVRRQKAINAANLNNVSGQGVGMHGIDLKPCPETKNAQKGDPDYQV
ncbi:unnamed protein product [Cochlearia groenlandica]